MPKVIQSVSHCLQSGFSLFSAAQLLAEGGSIGPIVCTHAPEKLRLNSASNSLSLLSLPGEKVN